MVLFYRPNNDKLYISFRSPDYSFNRFGCFSFVYYNLPYGRAFTPQIEAASDKQRFELIKPDTLLRMLFPTSTAILLSPV